MVSLLRAPDTRVLTRVQNLFLSFLCLEPLGTCGLPPLAARPAMAVPPAKGLDEACAWLRKAALTPFPTGH